MGCLQLVLFDFDGTIANTLPLLLDILDELAPSYKLPYSFKEPSVIEQLRNSPLDQALQDLAIPLFMMPFFIRAVKQKLRQNALHLEPIVGIIPALQELAGHGYRLGIVTSNSKATVNFFLQNHNLPFFEIIYTDSSLFGKPQTLKQLLYKYKIAACDSLYIGDEVRDIQAAYYNHMSTIAVTWGFNTESCLQKHNPQAIISSPSELPSTVLRLFNHTSPRVTAVSDLCLR
jgi:phosphoglycolate phosphatase